MTAALIRAKYVGVVGETTTAQLEAAGLLPSVTETEQRVVADTPELNGRTVVYRQQTRYATAWKDA